MSTPLHESDPYRHEGQARALTNVYVRMAIAERKSVEDRIARYNEVFVEKAGVKALGLVEIEDGTEYTAEEEEDDAQRYGQNARFLG